ncbi:MAG: hypothetical protein HY562_12190 [Ignavibacteriales bacterium]|nr:hypothetical protein [Ignavibacteriales bacterium]
MKIHLVDGTYELFRNYYGAPEKSTDHLVDFFEFLFAFDLIEPGSVLAPACRTNVVRSVGRAVGEARNRLGLWVELNPRDFNRSALLTDH